MSVVLDAEPLVLEEMDQALQCGYISCEERAAWSTIWTCGETTGYCEPHLRWAQRVQPVLCMCDGVEDEIAIVIMMTVPL